MAERTLIVCDVCGEPAVQVVNMKVGGRTLTKDVCARHLQVMTEGARTPRPGRRAGVLASGPTPGQAKRRGRPPGSKRKAARKRVAKRSTTKRAASSRGKTAGARRGRKRASKAPSAS